MRRSVTAVIGLVAAVTGVACEDGPSQTYSTAPNGAGSVWNGTPGGGGIPAEAGTFVAPSRQSFDASSGGQNANDLCTAAQEKTTWTANFTAPIVPPGLAGGIDIAGGPLNSNGVWGYDPNCLSYQKCSTDVPAKYGTYNAALEGWSGTTVEQAQNLLCQATATATLFDVTNGAGWGEQLELSVFYNTNSRIITDLILGYGYVGQVVARDAVTKVTYTVDLNNKLMMERPDGGQDTPISLNWTDGSLPVITNKIYEAMRQTFLPAFPKDNDCVSAGHCILDNNGIDDGILFFTPLNLAIFVNNTIAPQPAPSIPILIDLGVLKVLPFSGASVLMKLDNAPSANSPFTGPIAHAAGLGATGATRTCDYHLGMAYGSATIPGTFEYDCVEANAPGSTENQIAQAQLLGALAHGDENYQFDIEGVDPQFTASLTPTTVIADGQDPSPNDIAYEFGIDQFVLGPIANDYQENTPDTSLAGNGQDWHGIGLVTLEWANLVQQYMQANVGVTSNLSDKTCLKLFDEALTGGVGSASGDGGTAEGGAGDAGSADAGSADAAGGSKEAGGGTAASTLIANGCSGLEGIVTTAPPALAPQFKANALGPAGLTVDVGAPNCNATQLYAELKAGTGPCGVNAIAVGMKPGTWYSYFCGDAGGLDTTGTPVGYTHCIGGQTASNVYQGFYFDTMQEAVAIAYGHIPGQPGGSPIPETLASRRFYFQQFILAVVKYFQSANDVNTKLADIDKNVVDPNELFFDTLGGGFEYGEYVDRLAVNSQNQAPTSLNIGTNLLTSVINNFTFDRFEFRGEAALYDALKTDPTDRPGAEPLYITDLVGAPALIYAYTDPNNPSVPAYTNAVNDGPIDPLTGKSLYAPYKDAFGTSVLSIAADGAQYINSGLTIDPGPYELIQSAMVTVPVISPDPFAYTGVVPPKTGSVQALLPYLGGAGVGFPVTIDGSRDKFYNTQQVDFTGTSVNALVDYEYVATTNADGGVGTPDLVVRALETQNYLGLVFACVEGNPTTGGTDVLAVRMYQNGTDILDWIKTHTFGSQDPVIDCGIQIKYSIFGNYADYITFGVNPSQPLHGIRFGFNPGFGGSVVTDVTIFDPNIVGTLGQ